MLFKIPVAGFAACSGTGKTSLPVKMIPLLKQSRMRPALVKHSHHDFEIDIPGRDSYQLRKAGAQQVLIASDRGQALIVERPFVGEPGLEELPAVLDPAGIDLVLVEGFRHLAVPKIELHRPSVTGHLIHPGEPDMIAVASDAATDRHGLPLLDINPPEAIERFVRAWLQKQKPAHS